MYFVADPYGCPVHFHGYPKSERSCSCRFYWADDPHRNDNIIFCEDDDKNDKDRKYKEYKN